MVNFEKYEKDGKVAVLYSPNWGAGWYTWNKDLDNNLGLLFDRKIVEMVLDGKFDQIEPYCKAHYSEDGYYSCVEDLKVAWLDMGDKFRITEYDGNESIELLTETIWLEA